MDTYDRRMEGSKFTCFVCNVHVTSQGQLTSHLNGSRHKTKLRIQQRGAQSLRGRWSNNKQEARCFTGGGGGGAGEGNSLPAGIRYDSPGADYQQGTTDSNWYQPSPAKKSRRDFSNYRTPSGKYYCSTCNVTLNAEGQFAQHIDSKRHKSSSSLQRNYLESADFT
ncbi:zinc finger matrin-type protein 3-like [Liolophura sinensis]|uniref:zinc finger matrin-type protein 3-like n=1 Tax=Liolophura sinensis TaxID=3198878 RepID=UPI0031587E8D